MENIQLPHTLLSRFDLIFLILDPQDEVFDRRLGRHLVSLYYKSQQESNEELIGNLNFQFKISPKDGYCPKITVMCNLDGTLTT